MASTIGRPKSAPFSHPMPMGKMPGGMPKMPGGKAMPKPPGKVKLRPGPKIKHKKGG